MANRPARKTCIPPWDGPGETGLSSRTTLGGEGVSAHATKKGCSGQLGHLFDPVLVQVHSSHNGAVRTADPSQGIR